MNYYLKGSKIQIRANQKDVSWNFMKKINPNSVNTGFAPIINFDHYKAPQ